MTFDTKSISSDINIVTPISLDFRFYGISSSFSLLSAYVCYLDMGSMSCRQRPAGSFLKDAVSHSVLWQKNFICLPSRKLWIGRNLSLASCFLFSGELWILWVLLTGCLLLQSGDFVSRFDSFSSSCIYICLCFLITEVNKRFCIPMWPLTWLTLRSSW